MKKKKEHSKYRKILKEQAAIMDIKVCKGMYAFLDKFMMDKEDMFTYLDTDVHDGVLEFTIGMSAYQECSMRISLIGDDYVAVKFMDYIPKIQNRVASEVGRYILEGNFINNYLEVEITLIPDDGTTDMTLEITGKTWLNLQNRDSAMCCESFMLGFVEEINQAYRSLEEIEKSMAYHGVSADYITNKIRVIKALREKTGINLRDAKNIVEKIPYEFLAFPCKGEYFNSETS